MNNNVVELLHLICDANKTIDEFALLEKLHHIFSYGSFLYYTGKISYEEFLNACYSINCNDQYIKYDEERMKNINLLLDNNYILNNLFRNNIINYWKYDINKQDDNIDLDISKEFIEFLKYANFYELYLRIKNSNHIGYSVDCLDHSVCLDDRKLSYIVLHNNNSFNNYLELSHEMAHAYENSVLSKYQRCFELPFNSEILAITFNRIFIEYLYQNNKINHEVYLKLLSDFEINYYNFLKVSLYISNSIESGLYNIRDYNISIFRESNVENFSLADYNYAIGRICSFKLFDDWLKSDRIFINKLPQLIDDLYHMNIFELVYIYGDNNDIMHKELSKNFSKKNIGS